MTCSCPPRWCYAQADCRKLSRVVGKRHPRMPAVGLQPIGAIRLQWLEDRHDALVAELKEELPDNSRIATRNALAAIDAAIARHQ